MLSRRFCLVSLSALAAMLFVHSDSLLGQESASSRAQTVAATGPLGFEQNYGQTSSQIKYVASMGNLRLELRSNGFNLSTGSLEHERTILRVDFTNSNAAARFTASERL